MTTAGYEIRNTLYETRDTRHEIRIYKAFTLVELVVAIGILAMVLSFASVIFNVSIESHRVALANAEIMQKLRTITDQLDADFKSLRKDGEIFVAWTADYDPDIDRYVRFDRIMFFANGDFQSYGNSPVIRGNVARICYMLAKNADGKRARDFTDISATEAGRKRRDNERRERILARTQHILVDDTTTDLIDFLTPGTKTDEQWFQWNNTREYEVTSLQQWKYVPWERQPHEPSETNKQNTLSAITDVTVDSSDISETVRGATIDKRNPNSIHMLLCDGVGEFKIQGWYETQYRWLPEVDPDSDGLLADSDFFLDGSGDALDPIQVPGVLYPYIPYGGVSIRGINYPSYRVNQENFNEIPGLGQALKFTFTLYDSKGIIKEGRTFTHIVYLGD